MVLLKAAAQVGVEGRLEAFIDDCLPLFCMDQNVCVRGLQACLYINDGSI